MSKPHYHLLDRLRACWHLLRARSWLLYRPVAPTAADEPGAHPYLIAQQGLDTGDCCNLRHWANSQQADVLGQRAVLDTLLNLNPGIAPAPDQ